MFYRAALTTISILFCQFVFADSCPTVDEIKNNELKSWKAYDSDNRKLLSKNRFAEFKNAIEEFALAEWVAADKKQGSIHCFYRDKHGSTLETYLEKNHFNLSRNKEYWYEVSGAMHCAADANSCGFYSTANNTRLAKK